MGQGWGAARALQGPLQRGESVPKGISCLGKKKKIRKKKKHISERLESCQLLTQGQGTEEQAATGLPRSGGAEHDGRAAWGHVLCHLVPPFLQPQRRKEG